MPPFSKDSADSPYNAGAESADGLDALTAKHTHTVEDVLKPEDVKVEQQYVVDNYGIGWGSLASHGVARMLGPW
jgi:hypothetical protein